LHPVVRLLPLSLAFGLMTLAHAKGSTTSNPDRIRELKHPADLFVLCRGDAVPAFPGQAPVGKAKDRPTSPANVWADVADFSKVGTSFFQGNAEIRRADQWVLADRVTYQHEKDTWQADGSIRYQDNSVRLTADHAEGDMDADITKIDSVQNPIRYQLRNTRGNGVGAHGRVEGDEETFLDGTYSTCNPDDRRWEIHGDRIEMDRKNNVGTVHGATVRIGGVPVVYLPWFTFSLNDQRKSGLLAPTFGSSSHSGFMYAQPYYFNLAPNYDATLTGRLYGQRGLMLDGEFRYLTERSHGTIEATWLPDDRQSHRDRSLIDIKSFTSINPNWYATVDINHVSDPFYLQDFSEEPYGSAIGLLSSTAGFYGRGRYWTAGAYVQDWDITDPLLAQASAPYRRVPDTWFRWQQPFGSHVELGFKGEGVRFDQSVLASASRVDLYPYVAFPFEHAAWFVRPEIGYRYTAYNLDQPVFPGGTRNPIRALPIADLDMGMYFDRNVTWFGHDFVNTLEPRLYYLRVPYRNQDDIPVFDTQDFTFSFEQLFRTNAFVGADRQTNANQLTAAVTTRLLDAADGTEWLTASMGQIRYFDPPRVLLPGQAFVDRSASDYVANATLALDDRWNLRAEYQYDPHESRTDVSSIGAQYKFGAGGVVNAAYRYRRDLIRETDVSFIYPLNANWRVLGRWDYSLLEKSTLEGLAGVEWQDCCMAVRFLARDYIRNTAGDRNVAFFLEIELKGLGSFGRDTSQLLDRDILGYTR